MTEPANTDQESFNEEFCLHLEYHLGHTFQNSERKELQSFWCDGVLMPYRESQLSKKSVNDTRKMETKAWIGPEGQFIYTLIVKFGKYALRRYARGTSLLDCIPSEETMDWIHIDVEKCIIEIQLK